MGVSYSTSEGGATSGGNAAAAGSRAFQRSTTSRFRAIADQFQSLEQVQDALRRQGLESSNLIVAVDFTKSNEWTGKHSFGGRSLHAATEQPNPYEEAISIIGRTLASFDDDQLIPCYGFGDVTTQDKSVFSFMPNDDPCQGLDAVLWRYRDLAPRVKLAGPTSFAPAIHRAMNIVADSGGQYHILLLIADGQVTRSSDLPPHQSSPQEAATVAAIVAASKMPLSIVMVGVGDGPWTVMREFDDRLPQRDFDNFQFVNFTEINTMYRHDASRKEAQFALRALMEIPDQYREIQRLGLLGCTPSGHWPRLQPHPPPAPLLHTPPQHAAMQQNQQPGNGYAYQHQNSFPAIHQQGVGSGQAGFNQPPAGFNQLHPAGFISQQNSGGSGGSAPFYPHSNAYPTLPAQGGGSSRLTGVASGNASAPGMYVCPITQDVMEDPVIAADGYTYERSAIESWLTTHNSSPMTNNLLRHKEVIPNHGLRSAISEAKQRNEL
eukprot:jgi/Chrzof1/11348/Cz05g33090.t1